jgi:hypothetical protein
MPYAYGEIDGEAVMVTGTVIPFLIGFQKRWWGMGIEGNDALIPHILTTFTSLFYITSCR